MTGQTEPTLSEAWFRARLAVWQERLGLVNWQITVIITEDTGLGERSTIARLERSDFYDRATLRVHPGALDWRELPESQERDQLEQADHQTRREFIEATIVHELFHCALRDLMCTSDLVRSHLSPPICEVWDTTWRRAEEALCERLGASLVATWPGAVQ